MAPELAEARADNVGPWTDVFLLGAILYELLAGRAPSSYRGEDDSTNSGFDLGLRPAAPLPLRS